MKRYITRHRLIANLTALTLLTICFAQPPAGAYALEAFAKPEPLPVNDHRDGILISNSVGFVPGQTLRMTMAHISREAGGQLPLPNVRVGAWLLDSSGRIIAQSGEVQIQPNKLHSFDFDRAAINLRGEPGTGRLQVSVRLDMHVDEPYHFTDDPKASGLLAPSLELIDNNTGRSHIHWHIDNRTYTMTVSEPF